MPAKYIGVDLDGTLAHHEPGQPVSKIGMPIPRMVGQVRRWLNNGQDVRVITARVADRYDDREVQRAMISDWLIINVRDRRWIIQSHKCGDMLKLWDDRAVTVQRNTGMSHGHVIDALRGEIENFKVEVERAVVSYPIPMYLTCPKCCARHIDEGEFATKPHHTHSCQECGLTWRPAVVPTVGVKFLPGFKND